MQKIKTIIELISKARKYGKYINAVIDIISYAQLRLQEVDKENDSIAYKNVQNEVGANNIS